MDEPVARIRPFEPSDDKEVRFIIGKSNMEYLAVANSSGEFILPIFQPIFSLTNPNPKKKTSLYPSLGTRYMVRPVLHFHRAHALVARCWGTRESKLPEALASFRGRGCTVNGFG
jgi:hypothetical protein